MALTPDMIEQLEAELSDDPIFYLVTIDHDDLATPIRLCTNYEALVSRGDTYQNYPHMELALPDDTEDQPPRQSIVLEDIDRVVVEALRTLPTTSPPSITIEVVLGSDLDTVQDSWTGQIREASYDYNAVEAEMRTDELLGVGAPALSYTPSLFPAMFAAD